MRHKVNQMHWWKPITYVYWQFLDDDYCYYDDSDDDDY